MFVRPASRPLRLAALVIAAAAVLMSRDRGGAHAQAAGPVAAYAFSDGAGLAAADASGNNNSGALPSGAGWTTGVYGGGLQLHGVNDAVQIAPSSSLDLTGGFTFETWIKPTAANDTYLLWRRQDSGQDAYIVELAPNGTVTVAMYTNTAYYPLTTVPRISPNVWTQIAVTYDAANVKIFFDGVEVARRTVAGTLVASSQPIYLAEGLAGLMDETRIYRRALQVSEIVRDRGTPVDAGAPFQLTVSTPAANAAGVLTTPITAMFSRDVNGSTITANTFELRDNANALVSATVGYNPATRTATLTPAAPLLPSASYTARVVGGSGGVTDAGSNTLAADVSWSFRTAAASDTPSAAFAFSEGAGTTTIDWSGNGNPAALVNGPTWTTGRFGNGVRVAGNSGEVQVAASETVALSNAFTFETWIYPTQYAWGDIWKQFLSDGSQIYGLAVTASGAVYFSPRLSDVDYPLMTMATLPLNMWTHLSLVYDGSTIRIYFNGAEMASRPASGVFPPTAQPMEIGQWTVGKLDEVRIYRAALDPAAIAADLSTLVDPTPPFQVTANTPIGGAQGVLTTPVTATFNRAVDGSSLTGSTFVLLDAANTAVAAGIAYDASSRTATLLPKTALAPVADYTATLIGGPNGVKDISGATLAGNVSWSFRTAPATAAPAAAYAFSEGSGTIAADASGNGNAATLVNGPAWTSGEFGNGVRFAAGYDEVQVPAVESLAMSGGYTFEAWIYPTASVVGDLWKQLLPSSEQIYGLQLTNSGVLSFLATLNGVDYPLASVVKVPLNAWSHVAVTGDGSSIRLFIDGIEVASRSAAGSLAWSSQPMEVGQWFQGRLDEVRIYRRALSAAEIALDRVTPIDAAAPFAVSGTTPSNGTLGVLSTPITATFTRAVQASTVTAATFELRDSASQLVGASVTYDAATRTATLTPSSALPPLADYTARVVSGSAGIIDASAHTLPADVTWSFRTAAAATSPSATYSFVEGSGTITADGSGNGHTASLVHGPAWAAGKLGSGLWFAGTDDEVQAAAGPVLGLSRAFTFEGWLRPSAFSWGEVWTQRRSDGSEILGVATTSTGAVYVSSHLGNADYGLSTAPTLSLNAWTHVAVTYDGAYLRVYLDGVEAASQAASGALAESTQPIEMGQWLQGALDEIRIYRIALDAAGIAADRARSMSCSYATSTSSVNAGSSGASGSFSVAASDGCQWTPKTNASWVAVARSGNAVVYSVAPNTAPTPRSAPVAVADQVVTVMQDAAASCLPATASARAVAKSNACSGKGKKD